MSTDLSRRSFVRLATGALSLLPRVAGLTGGFLLATAPQTALAAEGEGVDPAHIVLIDPDELGIQVLDVASGLALPGAHVTLTSFAEGAKRQTIEGDTDSSGVWTANVKDLCEPEGLSKRVKVYEFYASIDVSKEGYRPFTTALVRAVAGNGLAVSTQPIEPQKPYPRRASLNEFDVLYTANEFIRSTANDVPCTLELQVENLPSSVGTVEAQVWQGDAPLGPSSRFSVRQNTVLASFERPFLQSGATGALAAGAGVSVHLSYAADTLATTELVVPLNLVVMDAPAGLDAPLTDADATALLTSNGPLGADKKPTFTLFNRGGTEDSGLSFPKDWPVIGGQKLKIWTPETFIGFAADPFGFVRISVKTPPLGQKDRYGKKEEDRKWGWHPRSEMKSQIAKYTENLANQKQKERDFLGSWDPFWQEGLNPEALTRDQPTKKLAITAMGELFAVLQWKTKGYIPIFDAEKLEGVASAHVMCVVDYNYKQQFVAGCIPMIFTFGVKGSLDFSLSTDITSPSFGELLKGNFDWDLTKTGFFINFCISISLSLGVGVDGLLSASLRGTFTITLYLGFPTDGLEPWPHFAFYMGFTAKVVLQFLLFTHEWTPLADLQEKISGKEPLYDNRKAAGVLDDYVRNALKDAPRTSLFEFMNEGTSIVTNETLESRSEFAYTDRPTLLLANDLVSVLQCQTQTFATDDGTSYAMDVYIPVAQDRLEGLKQTVLTALGSGGDADGTEGAEKILAARLGAMQDEGLVPVFGTAGGDLDSQQRLTMPGEPRYSFDRLLAGVHDLGLLGGVRPTSEVVISEDVFSDPRTKVVSIFGRPCLVRIATVELGSGDTRTRLVLQEIPSDTAYAAPLLLDFKLSVGRYPRYEYYDYSFDVCQSTTIDEAGKERCDLHLLVVSGTREDDDETTLTSAAQGHIFSYVRYAFTNPNDLADRYAIAMQVTPDKINATDCPDDWDNHLYLTPQIKLTDDGSGNKAVAMSFVERAGRDERAVLNDQNTDETRVGVGMFFASAADGGRKDAPPVMSLPDLSGLRQKLGEMDDLALTDMTLMGEASGLKTIKFAGDINHYLLLGVNPAAQRGALQAAGDGTDAALFAPEAQNVGVPGISQILRVSDETIASTIGADVEPDPDQDELFPDTQLELAEVPGADYFLTCIQGRLQKVTWGGTDGDPYPVLEACGPEGVQISSFAVDPTGEFIYWPTVTEGDAPVTLDANGKMQPTQQERAYRIMACRMRNGEFSKPFPLAEQDTHGFDTLEVLENTREGISFVSTEVVDATQAQANLWFTVVPHLRCLSVAYLAPENALLHVGDDVTFRIALRNDGNTYLRQATIRLTDQNGTWLADHTLVFSEDNTLVSQWNPQGEDGKPTGVESDYALAPGATSLYSLPGFTVPEGAPHDLYIYAAVVEGSLAMAETGGLSGLADDETGAQDVQEFLGVGMKTDAAGNRVVAGETLATVVGGAEKSVDSTDQRPSNVTVLTNGISDGGGNGGGGNGSGNGSSGGSNGGGNGSGGIAGNRATGTVATTGTSPAGSAGTTTLPNTGDGASAMGVAGLAAGAAGAAMLAYSRRRDKLEHGHATKARE